MLENNSETKTRLTNYLAGITRYIIHKNVAIRKKHKWMFLSTMQTLPFKGISV